MPPAIRVENLGKSYRITHEGLRCGYRTLRESIMGSPAALMRHLKDRCIGARADEFWALSDLSLEVQPGEIVGIIGHNGAGKSTLLKILSRITKPTTGRIEIFGRIGSLLEVGTGFHPELTGRENIFLNGSILGMSRREIGRHFDEIVDFSGVERFLDTPVKRYSSGMYVRLAFAVAAHLDPEILLVDEVLAVGDAAFQKKCLGKMEGIVYGGRTILLVSHQMSVVQRLSHRVALIENGRLLAFGPKDEIIAQYLTRNTRVAPPGDWIDTTRANRRGNGAAQIVAARYRCPDDIVSGHPYTDGPLEIRLAIESNSSMHVDKLGIWLSDRNETPITGANITYLGKLVELQPGRNEVSFLINQLPLNPGTYPAGAWIGNGFGPVIDFVSSAFQIEVMEAPTEDRMAIYTRGNMPVPCKFNFNKIL